MSKPKDKRNEWNRQHRRILEAHAALQAQLEGFEAQKANELAELADQLAAAEAKAERYLASNRLLERDLDLARGQIEGVKAVLEIERQERAAEKAALEAQIAAHAPALARLEALVVRWEGRAKSKELEEAQALLNRKVLAQAVPGVNRRG